MRKIAIATAATVALYAGLTGCDKAPEATAPKPEALLDVAVITPVPLPTTANYPVAAATINGWIANADTAAIRNHAWQIWQAMAQPSGQSFNGQSLPIWETWAGTDDVFPPAPPAGAAAAATTTTVAQRVAAPRKLRVFQQPNQFHHGRGGITPTKFDTTVTSFNKFSPEAATFLDASHPGPGGVSYRYSSTSDMQKLNASWPAGTTPQDRGVQDFPVRGIELKPVFGLVHAKGLTPQPLWQGPAASTNAQNPEPQTWTTCVLVAPTGQGPVRPATPREIASIRDPGACKTFLWAPMSTFYSVKLSAAEAQDYNTANGLTGADAAVPGDFAVLQAMHVNSKEIPFWTWQTFWWQPGADTPNGFPGSKQGQPASLTGPWTNYATCTAYDQTTTQGGSTMTVCFNPYLETSTGIPAGITSNCMSCHGVAVITAGNAPYPANYKKPIAFFSDPLYFTTSNTHADFSWALASNSDPN
ncbi:hypothetical protein V7S57_21760 [Caulobacter sp. CCNWLY153]|jgi:hypothetical protein|uniref:Uncharacterized protein n=1 Tax=Caulobacter radicis TaxID=2172650 RepID=A0A2T9JGH1_9CAUL|nr:hypothetical protein [Caulobacter radicis]PVM82801.1 hypothetical protein DDF65_10735 [Caulobacter radicis]